MRLTKGKKFTTAGVIALASSGLVATSMLGANGAAPAAAPEPSNVTHANLDPLNDSGVQGSADVFVDGRQINIQLEARRLLKKMPHAQHIHFGAKARHECPTVFDDDNADHRLTTVEGQPAYGPVKVSLTKRGDTSAKSTLAVKRYPKARHHQIHYNRKGIEVSKRVARAIRHGKAVLVIHGIDYNGNGTYDFSAGASDLDPSLPAEATDPAACGVLKPVPQDLVDPDLPVLPSNGAVQRGGTGDSHNHDH